MSLASKPSQMTVFDALYSIAAGDGRGEALFGNSFGLARDAYERTLIGDGYPAAYIEFPLLGPPGFDLLSVHSSVQPGRKASWPWPIACLRAGRQLMWAQLIPLLLRQIVQIHPDHTLTTYETRPISTNYNLLLVIIARFHEAKTATGCSV